ncbi:MAG: hypothetical protein APF77_14835 [Clostridia bacterium BRH_c25]|nr:MAG: hypothetical protein APF77_14835 [Clostridia bacterium BRH_c25]
MKEGTDKIWISGIEYLKDGIDIYKTIGIVNKKERELVLHADSYIELQQLKNESDGKLYECAFKYEFFDKILYKGNLVILAKIVIHELYEVQE